MCGRFVSASPPDDIARYFDVEVFGERALEPSFNVAPTEDVYVVLESGGVRRLDTFRWGLVPFWAKDAKVGQKMVNARAEGLADRGAYKRAFAKRRCIIPADGFFEWRREPGSKRRQPVYIHRADGDPLALAGLWELWRPDTGADDPSTWIHSCTIVTTEANDLVAPIHDRMPVVLPPAAWDPWLDRSETDLDALGRFLVPAAAGLLVADRVGARVNDVRNKDAAVLTPVDPACDVGTAGQQSLLP
jgi:putative SOS response-associated peptidase YedK